VGRSGQMGMFLMIGSALGALIMLIGVMRRSYLVIALPVLAASSIVAGLTFWVGWTIASTDEEMAELEEQQAVPAPA
jgi:uncharacterized membrane protein YphA (DoxX/SURF4 family)